MMTRASARFALVTALAAVTGLAGCAATEPVDLGDQRTPLSEVPASQETLDATGIATWQVFMEGGEVEIRGLGADGAALLITEIQPAPGVGVGIEAAGLVSGSIVLTSEGTVLGSSLSTRAPELFGALARDLETAPASQGWWDCLALAAASAAAGIACGAAVVELGLNPTADIACVLALDKANDMACSGDCEGTKGFGCEAE